MRRVLPWGFFVALLASLTWLLGQALPIQPRCVIGEDFHISGLIGLSPDGSRLITTSVQRPEGKDVWDTKTGKLLGSLAPQGFPGGAVSSNDGRFNAWQKENGTCIISDIQEVRQSSAALGEAPSRPLLFFSPQGGFLLVEKGLEEGKTPRPYILDSHTGKVVKSLPADEKTNSKILGFTPQDNLVTWNPENKRCEIRLLPSLELAHRKTLVKPFLFSPGNHFLVARDGTEPLNDLGRRDALAPWVIWDLSTGTGCLMLDDQGRPFRAALSADGTTRIPSPENRYLALLGLSEDLQTHFFSPDNRFLALLARKEKAIRVWETKTGKLVLKVESTSPGSHCAFSDDGKRLAIESDRYPLVIFDVESAKELWQGRGHKPTFLPYSHDLHIVEIDRRIRHIWLDGDTGKPIAPPQGFVSGKFRLVQGPTRNRWLLQQPTTRVQIFHLPTNKRLYDFNVPKFEDIKFSKDGAKFQDIKLSKDGRTLLTIHRERSDCYFFVWSLPPKRSALQFAIPLGLGIGALGVRWVWRLRQRVRARQKAAADSAAG
jgi:WD40 repeat protein